MDVAATRLSDPADAAGAAGAGAATVAEAALRVSLRSRTVVWLVLLFMAMVLVAAYLGWSATSTLDAVFQQAAVIMQAEGREVPPNPALAMSPLSALRNMTTYVSLLGALAAIIFGNQLIAADRKSGVFPIIASRPLTRSAYALGKVAALVIAIVGVLLVAAMTNAITVLLLPGQTLGPEAWTKLVSFYGVSALYLVAFGLLSLAAAAGTRSESLALLIPITVWLALTFVLPQITGNVNPMAALNPISAMKPAPESVFFGISGAVLAPVSLTEIYRSLAATILGFAPAGVRLGAGTGLAILLAADVLLALAAVRVIERFDASRSDYDD